MAVGKKQFDARFLNRTSSRTLIMSGATTETPKLISCRFFSQPFGQLRIHYHDKEKVAGMSWRSELSGDVILTTTA